jgi:hypothetical protein
LTLDGQSRGVAQAAGKRAFGSTGRYFNDVATGIIGYKQIARAVITGRSMGDLFMRLYRILVPFREWLAGVSLDKIAADRCPGCWSGSS